MKHKKLGRAEDLRGRTFTFLTVVERALSDRKPAMWRCTCRCGKETIVRADRLKRGGTKSCGCVHKSAALIMQVAFDEYGIWHNMLARCRDKKMKRYGGRGIKVCSRWRYFENFLSDMKPRPSKNHSLDRYPNNDGNYEPTNCRWATRKEQMRNTCTNIKVKIDGKEVTLIELSEKAGLNRQTVIRRLNRGWTVEGALSQPPGTKWAVADDYPIEWLLGVSFEPKGS